jgi:hypothetical protein
LGILLFYKQNLIKSIVYPLVDAAITPVVELIPVLGFVLMLNKERELSV